jgi:hypothetical protein
MKVFRLMAVIALLMGPAYAQTPELIHSFAPEKTPRQKADDELREKFSRESGKKVPEAEVKTSIDPWGNVRSGDAAKTSASKPKTSASKTTTSTKPQTKTGTDAN